MKLNDEFKNSKKSPFERSTPFFTSKNFLPMYVGISILLQMKEQLGIEAMLEYMAAFQRMIESNNPKVKKAVKQALALMSVEKMYKDAIDCEKP